MADAFTSETYNALCRDAEGYLARGLAEQARELLLKATGLIGTRARARSLLADACMQLTLWDEAKSQLEALATLEVDNIYTHFRLGQVLEETSDYELARDNFFVVLDMNPDHHGAKVALSRLENISSVPSKEKTSLVEGQQIFADSTQDEGIFAEDSSSSIDALLNTIGMGEKAEVPGVEDLLDTIGMSHKEEKKEEKPAVDFSSIFGAPAQNPELDHGDSVSDAFDNDAPADLGSMFGGSSTPEPVSTETVPEVLEEPQTDLGAMFGGS
ncbi:MAG: tetratricopeptide repeat protein, partial [Candidatus Sabulitectum sp.]|nr:tetratricopeptide repeat protein [Candidatus Sabulitectum sp.]